MKTILSVFLLCLMLFSSCNKDESILDSNSLVWQPSPFSLPADLTFSASFFNKGEDGKLYLFGYGYNHSNSEYQQPLLVLDANGKWRMMADLTMRRPWRVHVFKNGEIFVSSNEGLYKIEDENTQLIHGLDGEFINDITSFNGELLMHGHISIDEKQASVFSYKGTSFSLIADERMFAIFLRDNDNLFVRLGSNLYKYDGNTLSLIVGQAYINIIKIRNNEFYSLDQVNGLYQIVKEDVSGKKLKLGDPFASNIFISQLLFLGDIPVAIGSDNDKQLSVAYFYQNKKWHSISTIAQLNNIIEYEGKILATLYDNPQTIIELVKE